MAERLFLGGYSTPKLAVVNLDTLDYETGWAAPPGNVEDVAVTSDGSLVATMGPSGLFVVDAASKTQDAAWPVSLGSEYPNGYRCAFSPDGSRLAVTIWDAPGYVVLDVASKSAESGWPVLASSPGGGQVRGVAWSPTGEHLFIGARNDFAVIDVAAKSQVGGVTLTGNITPDTISISPDGLRAAYSIGTSPGYGVIDLALMELETGWPSIGGGMAGAAFSPDGGKLAVASGSSLEANRLVVYEVETKSAEAGWPVPSQGGGGHSSCSWVGAFLAVPNWSEPLLIDAQSKADLEVGGSFPQGMVATAIDGWAVDPPLAVRRVITSEDVPPWSGSSPGAILTILDGSPQWVVPE